jgi:hypothetical protein
MTEETKKLAIVKVLNESEYGMTESQIAGKTNLFVTEVRWMLQDLWAERKIENRYIGRIVHYYTAV